MRRDGVRTGSLLGRERETAGAARALELDRLVTLAGPPGIGKTQLALAVADRHDDAVLVELAPLADPALLPAALAGALSVQELAGQPLLDTVVAAVGRRRLLLLLDNCEHLLGACRAAAVRLLEDCPEVRVLATSREPLGLTGERVQHVPPLPVPAHDGGDDPDLLMTYPSVRLLVRRARAAQPGFALTPFVARDVAEICRRLDGIPLAIELAAARVEALMPREIVRRLEHRLSPLGSGGSPRSRHRTVEAAIDWSYALLDSSERALLRRVSVFTDRFDAEAARAVCAGPEIEPAGVPHLLGRLVSKSLLVPELDADGVTRFRLLETIRAYAADRLEAAGEVSNQRTAHARFYLALAERSEPELTGPDQQRWLARLEAQRGDLRAALEWSLGRGDAEAALRLAGALILFWRVRCRFSEGRDLLGAVLSAGGPAPDALTAKVLWGLGFLTFMAGDPSGALPLLERSLATFRELGDPRGAARALLILANTKQIFDDDDVLELLEESAQLARAAGDSWCLAHALGVAGFELAAYDEPSRAREVLEECLEVARESRDPQSLRIGLLGLGSVAVAEGSYSEAESLLEEAIDVTRELGEGFAHAFALRYLAVVAIGRGDFSRARELLSDALARLPVAAPPGHGAQARVLLARVAVAEGDTASARTLLDEVETAGDHGPSVMCARGELAAREGDRIAARRLFEEACARTEPSWGRAGRAGALQALAQLARDAGDRERAASLQREALQLRLDLGARPGIADSLEAAARLASVFGGLRHAARMFGAAASLREEGGYVRRPSARDGYELDLTRCRSLPRPAFDAAYAEGRALTLEQAGREALRGLRRAEFATGWSSLTEREREVVGLVAADLTNLEIAERLVIALETVKSHLAHIFAKLEVHGRAELACEARARGAAEV